MANQTTSETINTTAVLALTKCLQQGACRRHAIVVAREELMEKLSMTRDAAELACWRVMAEMEAGGLAGGNFIDLSNSTSHLLVLRTPQQKILFTLRDLLALAELHREPAASSELLKPTIH